MLYCAYGSNLDTFQMSERCPDSKVIGTGMLRGWKLVFKYHADIVQDEYSSVPVLVWNVSSDDIKALDSYEGYPDYYGCKLVEVRLDKYSPTYGRFVYALAYVMNDFYNKIEMPDRSYFEHIENEYIKNGMDLNYLYKAYREAKRYDGKYLDN